jgi:cytochrome c-type biogenesis protein CcmE
VLPQLENKNNCYYYRVLEIKGIITTGSLVNGRFIATEVLAKHDENYMPPEVADALKQAKE